MKASIVVPTFNRKERLKKCLNALLSQDFQDYEIIVIDDGSSDGTEKLVENMKNKKIVYFRQKNKGPGAARNFGVKKAKGEIVALTDDDCIAEKNWLKELLRGFDKKVGIVGGSYIHHEEKGVVGLWQKCNLRKSIERGRFSNVQFFESNNMAIRKDVFLSVQGFDLLFGKFDGSEDLNLNYQVIKKGFKLSFSEKAKLLHLHKKTLKGVLKQYYIAGRGDIIFMHLNPEKKIFRPYYFLIVPAIAFKDALKQTDYSGKAYLPLFALFNFLCLLCHQYGKAVRSIIIKRPSLFFYNADKKLR